MPKKLSKFLFDRKKAMIRAKQEQGFRSRSNEIVMDIRDTTPIEIVGGDFVNRKLEDGLAGKLLTTNSLKFYGNKITKEYGFALKMHKKFVDYITHCALVFVVMAIIILMILGSLSIKNVFLIYFNCMCCIFLCDLGG